MIVMLNNISQSNIHCVRKIASFSHLYIAGPHVQYDKLSLKFQTSKDFSDKLSVYCEVCVNFKSMQRS